MFSVNVAFQRPVFQFRNGGKMPGSRAVDDDRSTQRAVCTKSTQGPYPWLDIDLGRHTRIMEVSVLNRNEGKLSARCDFLNSSADLSENFGYF